MGNRGLPIGSATGIGVLIGAIVGLLIRPMFGSEGEVGLALGVALGLLAGTLFDSARTHRAI